jgi:hypothetical protein
MTWALDTAKGWTHRGAGSCSMVEAHGRVQTRASGPRVLPFWLALGQCCVLVATLSAPIAVNIAAGARGVLALCNISGCVVGLAETRGWC